MTFEHIYAGEPIFMPVVCGWDMAGARITTRPFDEPLDNDIQRLIKEIELNDFVERFLQKNKDEELSAGDTELLDEYLHSFLQAGA